MVNRRYRRSTSLQHERCTDVSVYTASEYARQAYLSSGVWPEVTEKGSTNTFPFR
jgi:hypothetical protein